MYNLPRDKGSLNEQMLRSNREI